MNNDCKKILLLGVTLYNPRTRKTLFKGGTMDYDKTNSIIYQINELLRSNIPLRIWVNIRIESEGKYAFMKQIGEGYQVVYENDFERIRDELYNKGLKMIKDGQSESYFSSRSG